jgi:hypothetical protein
LYFLQTKEYDNENDNSNVIYSELNVYKFMFMGDAGIDKEKDILDKYNLSNVDVLKVGHHGSKTSSSKEFINVINPKYSIISIGKNNRYGHPNKEVLNKIDTYWKELSNNGPWTGSNDICYDTFTIRYDNNNVVQKIDLQIVDNDSIVLKASNGNTYYNHANNLVTYLRSIK